MADAVKLREAVETIRVNKERWSQSQFISGVVVSSTDDWHECGTTLCLAGWGAILNGYRPQADEENRPTGWVYPVGRPYELESIEDVAIRVFDLTDVEADHLFFTFTQDVDVLPRAVERVINGEDLYYSDDDDDFE